MANEMTGITFWKHAGYTGDVTKKCALTGDDLDRNFFNLKSEDIKDVKLSGNTLLIDTWRKKETFSIDLSKYDKDLSGYYTSGETNEAIIEALEVYWTSAQTVSAMTLVFNAVNKSIENLSKKTNEEFLLHPAYDEIIKMVKDGTEFPEAFDESGSVITWSDTLGPFYKQCEIDQKFEELSGTTMGLIENLSATTLDEIHGLSAGTQHEINRLEDRIIGIVVSGATKEEIVKLVEEQIEPKFNEIDENIERIDEDIVDVSVAIMDEVTNREEADNAIMEDVNSAVTRITELEQQVLDIQAEIADIKSKLVDMIEGTDNQIKVIREEGRCKIGFADDAIFAADNNE